MTAAPDRVSVLLDTVRRAYAADLCIVPPTEDGTKKPEPERVSENTLAELIGPDEARKRCGDKGYAYTWIHHQHVRPTVDRMREWFSTGNRSGAGIVCGRISGNVELLEFDDRNVYQVYRDTAESIGLGDLIDRIEHGYLEETPGGGIHWFYYCDVVAGNTKLAERPGPPDEAGRPTREALIETRGEGGYAVIAPSNGRVHPSGGVYRLLQGSVETIETITAAERDALWRLARSFDEMPDEDRRPANVPSSPRATTSERPGDDFDRRASWSEILTPHGWTLLYQRGQMEYWRRPGKPSHEPGHSAITNYDGNDRLVVYSTSTPFDPHETGKQKGYSKFRAYALLNHHGDYVAAARELGRLGYGDQRPSISFDIKLGNSVNSAHSVLRGPAAEWEPPTPFHEADLPAFPVDALPLWLGEWVVAEAETTQTPVDLAAVLGLGAVAAVTARKVRVNPQPGWYEPVNLFTVSVLPPGSRKTTVFADATAPIEEYEAELASRVKQDIDAAELSRRTLEAELQKLIKVAAGLVGDDRLVADADVQDVGLRLAKIVVPELPRLIVDDCSPERLASLLATQDGRVAVMSPEGDVFEIMSGKYSSGVPSLGVYLKGHAGDSIRVDRVGRAPELIRRPALTMVLAIQPEVVQGLVERPGFRGRGLLGRFLYSLPTNTIGSRKVRPTPMAEHVAATYANRLRAILEMAEAQSIDGAAMEYMLQLSPDAERRFDVFVEWLEPQLGEFGDLAHIADWAGKLAGAVARIAGLLHTAKHIGPGVGLPLMIDDETVCDAITIGYYFIAHARAAFAEMGADPVVEDAKHLVRWLQRNDPVGQITRRDLFIATRSRFKKVEAIDPALRLLTDHGYLRDAAVADPTPDESGRLPRGRKPSPTYDVNPALYAQNSQKTQNTPDGPNSVFSVNSVSKDAASDWSVA